MSATRSDMRVVIPQYLIDMALKESAKELDKVVPSDEGPKVEQTLYVDEEDEPAGIGRLLVLGSIVASLLIFTGLQVANSHAPASRNIVAVTSGVQPLSAAELAQSVKTENRTVYWLNVKQGDSYTNSSSAPGVDQVIYRPTGANVADLGNFDVAVATYRDLATYDAQPHPFLGANGRTINLTGGATATYNALSPTQTVVLFPNNPEIVVLTYPAAQAVPTIINDATNLVPIS